MDVEEKLKSKLSPVALYTIMGIALTVTACAVAIYINPFCKIKEYNSKPRIKKPRKFFRKLRKRTEKIKKLKLTKGR